MGRNHRCILCGSGNLKTVLTNRRAPLSVAKLTDGPRAGKDDGKPLSLLTCGRCGMCQLPREQYVPAGFYEDYQMGVSFSRQMQDYEKSLARDFIGFFGLKGKDAFEVGCGDGLFASILCENGLRTTGVEPSRSFCSEARKRIPVLNQYLNSRTRLKKNFYDAFVSRQVFEHLANPGKLLKDVKRFLKKDGVGMIEVPSFNTALKDRRYYDIFRDHVAYYTSYTLQVLLTMNNFEVMKIFHAAQGEYLIVYFRSNEGHGEAVRSYGRGYDAYKKGFQNLLKENRGKRIAVWGAGGKGVTLLSLAGVRPGDVLFVIDSDPLKWNKVTPGSGLPVKPPQDVDFTGLDLIIVTAVMFQDEIIRDLRKKYKYRNRIGMIAPYPRVL